MSTRRLRDAVTLALVLLAAGVCASPARAAWGPVRTVAPDGIDADAPEAAIDSEGAQVVAFSVDSEAIEVRQRRGPGEVFSTRQNVSGPPFGPDDPIEGPFVAANDRDDLLLTWFGGISGQAFTAVRRPGGRFASAQFIGVNGGEPLAIDVGPDGAAVVAYSSRRALNVRSLAPDTPFFSRPKLLLSTTDFTTVEQVFAGPRGSALVAFSASRGRREGVFVARRSRARARWTIERISRAAADPMLAANSRGRAVIAWRVEGRGGGAYVATGSVRRGFGAPTRLTAPGERAAATPSVGIDARGRAVAALATGRRQRAQVAVAVGKPGRGFVRQRSYERVGRLQLDPLVRVTPSGHALVRWSQWGHGITVVTRRPGGRFTGSRDLLAAPDFLSGPQLVLGSGGEAIATWRRKGEIKAATWRAGASVGEPATLGSGACEPPRLGVGPRGHAALIWSLHCRSEKPGALLAAVREPGAPFGEATAVGQGGDAETVAVGADGEAFGGWSRLEGYDGLVGATYSAE